MNDIQTIKKNYQSMSAGQLQQLAMNEMDTLTPEAQQLLKEELKCRNIITQQEHHDGISNEPIIDFNRIEKHILHYLFQQKEKGESDAFITGGLLERGLEEEFITLLIKQFPNYIAERKNKMSQMILTGTLQLVSGIAIIELPLNKQSQLAIYIIAYSLIMLGAFRILHGYFNRRKLLKIIIS